MGLRPIVLASGLFGAAVMLAACSSSQPTFVPTTAAVVTSVSSDSSAPAPSVTVSSLAAASPAPVAGNIDAVDCEAFDRARLGAVVGQELEPPDSGVVFPRDDIVEECFFYSYSDEGRIDFAFDLTVLGPYADAVSGGLGVFDIGDFEIQQPAPGVMFFFCNESAYSESPEATSWGCVRSSTPDAWINDLHSMSYIAEPYKLAIPLIGLPRETMVALLVEFGSQFQTIYGL